MLRRLLLLLLLLPVLARGAELRVESFTASGFDISARTNERLDRNGRVCALVKVDLPIEGCKFEGNIIDSRYDVNEYWVWLSAGTKRFDIKCPGMRRLEVTFAKYSDIESLESGVTYVLNLAGYDAALSGGAKQPVDPGANYLIINVEPASAPSLSVRVDGDLQPVEDGQMVSLLPYGAHSYEVTATGYDPVQGTANVVRGDRTQVDVQLQSAMARLIVICPTAGASVSINSQPRGTLPWDGRLAPGNYMVEVSREGYRPHSEMITLNKHENLYLEVPELTPIVGTLSVNYRPVGSKITVDGRDAGTSPAILTDIVVGRHTVRVSHDGYLAATVDVAVEEGQTATVDGSLSKIEAPGSATLTATTGGNNLKLCATLGGKPYLFSRQEWEKLKPEYKQKYQKKGLLLVIDGKEYVLSLKVSEPMTWQAAVSYASGENHLPDEAQCRAIAAQSSEIDAASAYYGAQPPKRDYWLWGQSDNNSSAWFINVAARKVYTETMTRRNRVRPIVPLSEASTLPTL